MAWRICIFAAVAGILAFGARWWFRDRLAVASCRDAGGRWAALGGGYCIGAADGPPRP